MESTTQSELTGKLTQICSLLQKNNGTPIPVGKVAALDCRENDAGMSAYNLGRHGEAFQHFSEAIRLSPGNFIYHANRASAALHLGRADVAMQDAKYVPWLQHSEFEQQTEIH